MLANLVLGAAVIGVTVVIHAFGLLELTRLVGLVTQRVRLEGRHSRTLAMSVIVIGTLVVLTVEVWLWAAIHMAVGTFPDFETALYFSTVSFSTLGYGDVIPPAEWRLFAALEGINGFLLIGWSTAYLIAAGIRVGPFRSGEHF